MGGGQGLGKFTELLSECLDLGLACLGLNLVRPELGEQVGIATMVAAGVGAAGGGVEAGAVGAAAAATVVAIAAAGPCCTSEGCGGGEGGAGRGPRRRRRQGRGLGAGDGLDLSLMLSPGLRRSLGMREGLGVVLFREGQNLGLERLGPGVQLGVELGLKLVAEMGLGTGVGMGVDGEVRRDVCLGEGRVGDMHGGRIGAVVREGVHLVGRSGEDDGREKEGWLAKWRQLRGGHVVEQVVDTQLRLEVQEARRGG